MDWTTWFRMQLQTSGDGFAWAFERIPLEWRLQLPPQPNYLGIWQPARQVWHVTGYERDIVIPSMRQWLGEPCPDPRIWQDDDVTWERVQQHGVDGLIEEFRHVRHEQIRLLDALEHVDWDSHLETIWGHKPLHMVVTKTYQHTFEHGDTLLRMGLWWGEMLERQAAQQATIVEASQ